MCAVYGLRLSLILERTAELLSREWYCQGLLYRLKTHQFDLIFLKLVLKFKQKLSLQLVWFIFSKFIAIWIIQICNNGTLFSTF